MRAPRILASAVALTLLGAYAGAADMGTMQAAVVNNGALEAKAVPKPGEPTAGTVRIKIRAAAVNPADWKYFSKNQGAVPGFDAAGTIDAVGPDVKDYKVGDAVIAMLPSGAFAQYALAPTNRIAKKPAKLSYEEAAGIPVVGETAYRALGDEFAKLQKGQRVLIHGGAGGVGSAAVQIAKARGAHVIATASARNHDYVRSIGADEVIDYSKVKFEDKVKDVDVVVNTVDEDTGNRSIGVLKSGGILVSVVGPAAADKCTAAKVRCVVTNRNGAPISENLAKVSELADAGKYRVNIDQTFSLADANKAWDSNKQGHTRGKLVIKLPQ